MPWSTIRSSPTTPPVWFRIRHEKPWTRNCCLARASFTKLQERFGVMALDYVDRTCPKADFQKTEKKLRRDMEKVTAKLETRRASPPLTCLWPRQERAKTP